MNLFRKIYLLSAKYVCTTHQIIIFASNLVILLAKTSFLSACCAFLLLNRPFFNPVILLSVPSGIPSLVFLLLLLFAFHRNLFGTLLSLQPQIPSVGHGESREEKVIKQDLPDS